MVAPRWLDFEQLSTARKVSLILLGLGILLLVVGLLAVPDEPATPVTPAPKVEGLSASRPDPKVLERNIPIVNSGGYRIVVQPDGASYLISPQGTFIPVAPAAPLEDTSMSTLAGKVAERLKTPPPGETGLGRLVVLDHGIISIPKEGIVTYTGKDRVVVRDEASDTTTVYHVDGHTERQEKSAKRTPGTEKGSKSK